MHRHILILVFLITLISGCVSSETDFKVLDPENWPITVEATVDDIISNLSEKEIKRIRKTKKEDLIQYHFGWGTEIRNYYGLWRNQKLREDACGEDCHPDGASMIIIEKVWEKLQNRG